MFHMILNALDRAGCLKYGEEDKLESDTYPKISG